MPANVFRPEFDQIRERPGYRSENRVRFLAIASQFGPDIALYPGTVGATERRPDGTGFNAMFDREDALGCEAADRVRSSEGRRSR